jgi:excisionase family DNA binding protein
MVRSLVLKTVDQFGLREAAARLGVHYMTAYRYVRLGRLPATQRGGRWWVDAEDLERLVADLPAAAPPRRGRASLAAYRPRLLSRLVDGDESSAWKVLESAMVAGAPAKAVVLDILAPVLREVGDAWECGDLTVGTEHRATAVAIRLVGRLGPHLVRRGRPRGTVVLAGAAGDPHSLPVSMLAAVLRGEGWPVVDLGADTPAESVVAAVQAVPDGPRAVGLSLSARGNSGAVREAVRAVRQAAPEVTVLVGGPATTSPDDASALGADAWAGDAAGVLDLLDTQRQTTSG